MKTIKELLQITLKEGNLRFKKGIPNDILYENGYVGLCGFVSSLRDESNIISFDEAITIRQFIEHHRPNENSPLCTKNHDNDDPYYWPRGDWKPRQKWLKYHIKKIKE